MSFLRLPKSRAARRVAGGMMAAALAGGIAGAVALSPMTADAQKTPPSGPPSAAYPRLAITARDFAFDLAPSVPAGYVAVTMTNAGQEEHHAQFVRLKDGVTPAQLQAALMMGPEAGLPLVTLEGGPAAIDAGGRAEVILNLQAGNYLLLCFIESPDGLPHLAKGMVAPLQVGTGGVVAAPAPQSSTTVDMKDFSFAMPAQVQAGAQTWKVNNLGPQPHEMALLRLAPGVTVADLVALIASEDEGEGEPPAGPPPVSSIGGMQGLDQGRDGYVVLDLQAGNYVAVCFIPDPATGLPHAALGMISGFSVR